MKTDKEKIEQVQNVIEALESSILKAGRSSELPSETALAFMAVFKVIVDDLKNAISDEKTYFVRIEGLEQ